MTSRRSLVFLCLAILTTGISETDWAWTTVLAQPAHDVGRPVTRLLSGLAALSPGLAAQDPQENDVAPQAVCTPQPLPPTAPQLQPGVWKDVSPADPPFGPSPFTFATAIGMDLCNPAVIYVGVQGFDWVASKAGVYKTTNAGTTWTRVGPLDSPVQMQVNPDDGQHVIVADGVRGNTLGLWVSRDGGTTWNQTPGWAAQRSDKWIDDTYDVAADPLDFNHLLVTFHSAWGWTDTQWNGNSGLLETRDGGVTWTVHRPINGWGTAHGIWFINSTTWLLGTQGNGFWRTTNSGASWQQVTTVSMIHGGGQLYKSPTGALYTTGYQTVLRNADGTGASWTPIGGSDGMGIIGDGNRLYTGPYFTGQNGGQYLWAPESSPTMWTPFNHTVSMGPYKMVFDPVNRIVYSSSWEEGVLALKVVGTAPPPPGPPSNLRITSP
jgi:hypothetical protein